MMRAALTYADKVNLIVAFISKLALLRRANTAIVIANTSYHFVDRLGAQL